jgi:ribosomal protein L9
MKAANSKGDFNDHYKWTPLRHDQLVEFIETRRLTTDLSKQQLSILAGYSKSSLSNITKKHQRFTKNSFTALAKAVVSKTAQLQIELDQQPEKIEAPAKIEKPIYGVMSIQQMITEIKAAGYKVSEPTIVYKEV